MCEPSSKNHCSVSTEAKLVEPGWKGRALNSNNHLLIIG